jgi:hypothetical protein
MKSTKENSIKPIRGHLVRFHSPFPDEDPDQLYILLNVTDFEELDKSRADILALGTGLSFPPINTVKLEDLEAVKWNTSELIGCHATLLKKDGSKASGKITWIPDEENENGTIKTLEMKIQAIIKDSQGKAHKGQLLLNSFKRQK